MLQCSDALDMYAAGRSGHVLAHTEETDEIMATTIRDASSNPGRVLNSPVLEMTRSDGFFEFDRKAAKAAGSKLADQYQSASPFPHIVLDDFIDPAILHQVNAEFPSPKAGRFADQFSQLKTGYVLDAIRSAYIQDLLSALNSAAFLNFLEKLSGIRGLVSDARYVGGGLHETRRGGHLSIHADFNLHPLNRLHRRLNLILFLNEEWESEWGGALELWDQRMSRCEEKILPVLGRAVIFNTDSDSYHGHPDPLECPDGVTRRSIALYYYTAPSGLTIPHTTKWRKRPGTKEAQTGPMDRLQFLLSHLFGKREDTY